MSSLLRRYRFWRMKRAGMRLAKAFANTGSDVGCLTETIRVTYMPHPEGRHTDDSCTQCGTRA